MGCISNQRLKLCDNFCADAGALRPQKIASVPAVDPVNHAQKTLYTDVNKASNPLGSKNLPEVCEVVSKLAKETYLCFAFTFGNKKWQEKATFCLENLIFEFLPGQNAFAFAFELPSLFRIPLLRH